MAFDFTCLQTRNANSRSASSASVGARRVTTRRSVAPMRPASRVCARKPPARLRKVIPGAAGSGSPPVSSSRRFFRRATADLAASSASGATMTSVRIAAIFSAAGASSVRFTATMPPNGETGSQRNARSQASASVAGRRHAAGISVLDDRDRRCVELSDAFECRIGVGQVVVRQLLALHLHARSQRRDAAPLT